MAEFLLGKLESMGYTPAYLSRGYGRATKGFYLVDPTQGGAAMFGDEAFQVASRFPQLRVAVCENRVEGVEKLLALPGEAIDIVVLDDAFQHRRIHRDLDLVLIDANRPPWSDLVLPAGNLREFRRGLRRADMLLFTKFTDPALPKRLAEKAPAGMPTGAFRLEQQEPRPFFATALPDEPRTVIAFSGLGNNAFFFQQLKAAYPGLSHTFPFPDHHDYSPSDLVKILEPIKAEMENSSNLGSALILTSEKDYFRLKGKEWLEQFRDFPIFHVPVRMVPEWGDGQLKELLAHTLNQHHGKDSRSS